jgi:integrase/recombinase XerD
MYVRDPLKVVVVGPLAPYSEGFAAEVLKRGYRPSTAAELMQVAAHLSRWLAGEGLATGDLTGEVVEQFLVDRRSQYRRRRTGRGVAPLLSYLRQVQAVPEPSIRAEDSDVARTVEEYRQYLVRERGLTDTSIRRYLPAVRAFLATVPQPFDTGLAELSVARVTRFVLDEAGCRSKADAKSMVTALRSLLRFLFVAGRIPNALAAAVPTVANRRLSTLPKRLDCAVVESLRGGFDRSTASGRRGFAIFTLLARLGLRAEEVAAVEIDDVDWRCGELTVRGKGGRRDTLPLPRDVGEAMADYLLNGRPSDCATGRLFVSERAPRLPISSSAIRGIIAGACTRTGLPRIGAHRLRHTVASDLLQAGASLPEIGQVLRHRSEESTAIYAKVDRDRLRAVARPWLGGAA